MNMIGKNTLNNEAMDCGKPRLWSHGIKDHAIRLMDWPLAKAADIVADVPAAAAVGDNIVSIAGRS